MGSVTAEIFLILSLCGWWWWVVGVLKSFSHKNPAVGLRLGLGFDKSVIYRVKYYSDYTIAIFTSAKQMKKNHFIFQTFSARMTMRSKPFKIFVTNT